MVKVQDDDDDDDSSDSDSESGACQAANQDDCQGAIFGRRRNLISQVKHGFDPGQDRMDAN